MAEYLMEGSLTVSPYTYTYPHPDTLPQCLPSLRSVQCGQGGRKD